MDEDTLLPPPQFLTNNILDAVQMEQRQDVVASRIEREGSSVWCQGTGHTDRMCRFRNICYLPSVDKFVFFHHQDGSVLAGVPSDRFSPALLDWSSVENHNTQYFNYDDALADRAALLLDGAILFKSRALIFKRFLPDNVLHIFHDDLLPMFHTLQSLTGKTMANSNTTFDIQLVFMDDYSIGPYSELYSFLTFLRPVSKQELLPPQKPACFVDATMGISKETTWYDYGFHQPQRPKPESAVTAAHIRQFCNYMKSRFNIAIPVQVKSNNPKLIVFSRRNNRLILNENDLIMKLSQKLGVKVIVVSIEIMSISAIIEEVSSASIAVGMHGSIMSFLMFLPPGSLVVELFPYAISPNNYTPYKTLAELPGMNFVYRSWQNKDLNKTVTHPERPWQEGGINHLPLSMQKKIKESSEVSPHVCCRDPEFMYRIYQDTAVDIDSVVEMVRSYLHEKRHKSDTGINDDSFSHPPDLFPSEVIDLKCVKYLKRKQLLLSWLPAWNTPFLAYNKLEYEVLVRESGPKVSSHTIYVRTTTYQFDSVKPEARYLVSVRTVLNGSIQGPFKVNEVACDTTQ